MELSRIVAGDGVGVCECLCSAYVHIIPKYARTSTIKYNNEKPHWNTATARDSYLKCVRGINIDINADVPIEIRAGKCATEFLAANV